MRLYVLVLVVSWGFAVFSFSGANAAPEVAIHARTEIRMKPIRKDYGNVYVVSGTLVDRFSGQGQGNQRVTLTIDGHSYNALTEDNGDFEVRVPAPGGKQDVDVRFAGGDNLEPSQVRLDDVDVDKNPVDLSISTIPDNGGVKITVTASAGGANLSVPVTLSVGPAEAAPEDLAKVGQVTAGGAAYTLTRAAAGGAGARRVHASFAGDALYNPATADATFELDTTTSVELALGGAEVAYEDDVVASGRVKDDDGNGVAKAPVELDVDGKRVAQTVAGADGAFRIHVEARSLDQGRHDLQAIVTPTDSWMKGSRSDVLHVTIAAPQPVPISYTVAAFAITALAAGGFFAARNRPWQRLRRAPEKERLRADPDGGNVPWTGLQPARPSLVSTLRRAADVGMTGVVRDAVRHRPLEGAIVRMRAGTDLRETVTGPDGGYEFEGLPPGDWGVTVARSGHMTERFPIALPHRGELRGARIDLMPVREHVFHLYKRAALPVLPDPARWGVWSPRQVFDHVRRRAPAPALSELTDFVENAYFSARLPDEEVVPEAEARVDRALRERAAT